MKTKKIPSNWKLSKIILLFKKGSKNDIKNYRPISLMVTVAKIFSSMIEFRLRGLLSHNQSPCQAGFRKGFSTTNHLHVINQLIQKTTEYNINLHLAFIDFTKAFDLLNQNFMFQALINQGVNQDLVKIIQEMYKGLKAQIILDTEGPQFEIRRGVRQGDPLSPLLFNCALDEIFKNLSWEEMGLEINGEKINNLRFADDVVLVAESAEQLQIMLDDLNTESKKAGMEINLSKTKILSNETNKKEIKIDKTPLELSLIHI